MDLAPSLYIASTSVSMSVCLDRSLVSCLSARVQRFDLHAAVHLQPLITFYYEADVSDLLCIGSSGYFLPIVYGVCAVPRTISPWLQVGPVCANTLRAVITL